MTSVWKCRTTYLDPVVFKDVDEVVHVCDLAGLAAPVARLRPIGVVKG